MPNTNSVSKDEISKFLKKLQEADNTDQILEDYAKDIDQMCDVLTLMLAAGKGGKLRVATRRLCKTLGINIAESEKKQETGEGWFDGYTVGNILRANAKGKANKLTKDGLWEKVKSEQDSSFTADGFDAKAFSNFVAGSGTTPNSNGIFSDGKGRGKGYYVK